MTGTTTISLCICTMNRPEDVDRALASVRAGTRQPHEIIVSDDGHQAEVAEVAARHGAVYQRGPARGLGPNRNACLDAVSGTHVAFIDDDVKVAADFMETAYRIASEQVLTGWELNHSYDPPKKVNASNPSFLGFQNRPVGDELRAIVVNATVFPASLFASARFTERSRYGYEELDMARQAVTLGYRIDYSDDLWVNHYPSPTNRDRYARVQVASRLYLTARAYSRYERNRPKAAVFCAVAGAHQVISGLRRGQGLRGAVRPLGLALSYAREEHRQTASTPIRPAQ